MRPKDLDQKVKKFFPTIHYDTIAKILRGERRPRPELADVLEEITGIEMKAWLLPQKYPNPLLKHNNTFKTSNNISTKER